MNLQDISQAKNPDLRASLIAMQRAAVLARQVAIQTNTAIVVELEGKVVRIPASELRQADDSIAQQMPQTGILGPLSRA